MGNKTIVGIIRKGFILPLRSSYKSACHHPLLIAMAAVLALIYRFLPCIFNLLLSVAPVIICTLLLLAILLAFSEPNPPDKEDERWLESYMGRIGGGGGRTGASAGAGTVTDHKHCLPKSHVDDMRRTELAQGREAAVTGNSNGNSVYLSSRHCGRAKKDIVVLGVGPVVRGARSEHGREAGGARLKKSNHDTSKQLASGDGRLAGELSDSDSERGEGSLNGSVGDMIPMNDELHPLLDDGPLPDSEASSVSSSREQTSDNDDDGSEAEETENREIFEEDEEETNGEKDDGAKAVKWTADDEKNLRDVGNSELERNRRLELLIAKRRARNYQRSETEKNLIDLGNNEPLSVIEELSRLLVMIPSRKNPFDISYTAEDAGPGSAPSILLPRRNPFDLPSDAVQGDEAVPVADFSFQEVQPMPARDVFFRRHESFTMGSSMQLEPSRHERESRFKSFFMQGHNQSDGFGALMANATVPGNVGVSYIPIDVAAGKNPFKQANANFELKEQQRRLEDAEIPSVEINTSTGQDVVADQQTIGKEEAAARRGNPSEIIDDKQTAEPIYDSSPSAVGKSRSSAASLDEILLGMEKRDSNSSSSSSSSSSTTSSEDHMAEASEASLDAYANAKLWVASSSLALIDREEAEARELSEITEETVIQVGLSGPVGLAPAPAALPPLPFADTGTLKEKKVIPPLRAVDKMSSSKAFPSRLVLVNEDSRAAAGHSSEDSLPPPSPPSTFAVVESRVSILPPIPEEIVEDLKHDEAHDGVFH